MLTISKTGCLTIKVSQDWLYMYVSFTPSRGYTDIQVEWAGLKVHYFLGGYWR